MRPRSARRACRCATGSSRCDRIQSVQTATRRRIADLAAPAAPGRPEQSAARPQARLLRPPRPTSPSSSRNGMGNTVSAGSRSRFRAGIASAAHSDRRRDRSRNSAGTAMASSNGPIVWLSPDLARLGNRRPTGSPTRSQFRAQQLRLQQRLVRRAQRGAAVAMIRMSTSSTL